jgi:hypothetical protein
MTTFGAELSRRPQAGVSLVAVIIAASIIFTGIYAFSQAFMFARRTLVVTRMSTSYLEAEQAIQAQIERIVRQTAQSPSTCGTAPGTGTGSLLNTTVCANYKVGEYAFGFAFPSGVMPTSSTASNASLRNAAVARCKSPRILTDATNPINGSTLYFCLYYNMQKTDSGLLCQPAGVGDDKVPPPGSFWAGREHFVEVYVHLVDLATGSSLPCQTWVGTPTAGAFGSMTLYWNAAPLGAKTNQQVFRLHSRSFNVAR